MQDQQLNSSSDYNESQNHILKLREMLRLNLASQNKLTKIKQTIDRRKRQLEEIGGWFIKNIQTNQIFDNISAINEVKKVPLLLQDQILIKKNSKQEYSFIDNMVGQQQVKKKKQRVTRNRGRQIDLKSQSNAQKINFVTLSHQCGKQGLQLYKEWRKTHKPQFDKRIVQIDEDRLKQKKKIYGDNWEKIGYFFNGLTFQNLYSYYRKHLNNVQKGKWTLRQNLVLIALVECYGAGRWALISKKLRVKSQFQIRERFCNVLDPSIKENNWQQDDVKLLLQVAYQQRYRWSKIVKKIPRFANKTDNALRRKFRNIMIKKDQQEIKAQVKNKQLVKSILKFKKKYFNRKKKVKSQEINSSSQ